MSQLEQAPCGCRFGSQDGAFVFYACRPDCDLVEYVQRQSAEAGRPCHVIRLEGADRRGAIGPGNPAPIVTGWQTGHGVVVDRAMQGGVSAVAGFTCRLDSGQTFSGCASPEDARGMVAAFLSSAWRAGHPADSEMPDVDVNRLRDALDVDPSRLAEVIAAGRQALGL